MLCHFCPAIDLDELFKEEGYKYHSSVGDLMESTHDGCGSCAMILNAQWVELGGDVHLGYDQGPLETQTTTRSFGEEPGSCNRIRYCQDAHFHSWDYENRGRQGSFLWSFLEIAA